YAFALVNTGVYVYNMTAAAKLTHCGEDVSGPVQCPGVFLGKLTGSSTSIGIDGVGSFLALSRSRSGFEIWNVANPASPVKVMTGTTPARDIAMWHVGNSIYAGAVAGVGIIPASEMRIFDVSCIQSGPCSPTPVAGPISVPGG